MVSRFLPMACHYVVGTGFVVDHCMTAGRMLAVLPRGVMPEATPDFQSTEHGYVDLMRDDFNEGDTFTTMNKLAMELFTAPAEG